MNMKNIFYCLLPGLLLGACSNKVYEKTGDSVIVKVPVSYTHLTLPTKLEV